MATEQSYHYTAQDIARYLNGGMTTQEMHKLERAALTDPFLADAIDGYSMANAAVTAQHLNEIAALLHKTGSNDAVVVPIAAKKTNWWRWTAAAGVAGILGISAWMLMRNTNQQQIADSVIAKTEQATVVADSARGNVTAADNTNATGDTISFLQTDQSRAIQTDTIRAQKNFPPVVNAPALSEAAPPAELAQAGNQPVAEPQMQIPASIKPDAISPNKGFMQNTRPIQVEAETNQYAKQARVRQQGVTNTGFFTGQVTDNTGKPLPGATVIAGSLATVTNKNGQFNLSAPMLNDSLNIKISAIGFENENTTVFAGRTAGIALQPSEGSLSEVVIVGYGNKKKKATLGSFKDMKVDTLQSSEYPYPDGGWAHFYDELSVELGIDKARATKLLHLKFIIEDGLPTNFTILKTPDLAIADEAIKAIQKGPRWKNFRKWKNAEVKIRVQ